MKYRSNRRGDRPYTAGLLRTQLRKLIERADLRDSSGALLDLSSTHRFRHTKATSLINAGVPLHVVQRYLGHSSPEMTMHYAQTLDTTAKAEFLRYQKLTATGQPLTVPADDLYDLMALDARTDRVLPNGWCTLPPAQTCGKGNACLTCDLFVTDRRYLDVHHQELGGLEQLIDRRQDAHRQRTGAPMSESHVWLSLRRREHGALVSLIDALEHPSPDVQPLVTGAVSERVEQGVAQVHARRPDGANRRTTIPIIAHFANASACSVRRS